VPDLSRIARDQWRAALAPLSQAARERASNTAGADVIEAKGFVLEMELDDLEARHRVEDAIKVPTVIPAPPVPEVRRSLAGHQVNVRMRHADHADLERAAEILGSTPTQLARIFIVSGTRRALFEHRRAERDA
jgi:hypothetical protein